MAKQNSNINPLKFTIMKRIFTFAIALLSMFVVSQTAKALTFNVTVPTPTYQCWIVGNFNGWNNNQHQMTKVDDTHYTITIDESTFEAGITQANIKYKYLSGGGDWAFVEKDAEGAEITDRDYSVADVVLKWALVYNPDVPPAPKTVTISVLVPLQVIECYIVGTFNGWAIPTDSTKMTLVETTAEAKIFTITFFTEDANKLQYKFAAGPAWDYEQTSSANVVFPDPTLSTADHFVTEFKAYYDPSLVGTITVTATVPAGTDRVWLQGSALGWNWDNAIEATKNTDGTFTVAVPNVLSMEYRMYNAPDWDHPEVGEADPLVELPNRSASYPADANLNITVWGWKAPTAIKEINADKYKVYTISRTIIVEGVTSKVDIFDVSGRNIQSALLSGQFNSKTLNPGLYILKVDGATKKVSIR
jgi:hypothetical protein